MSSSGSLYQIAIGLDKDRLYAAIDQKGHNAKGCTNIDVREPIQQILSCLAHDLLQKQFGQMPWAIARLWNYRVLEKRGGAAEGGVTQTARGLGD